MGIPTANFIRTLTEGSVNLAFEKSMATLTNAIESAAKNGMHECCKELVCDKILFGRILKELVDKGFEVEADTPPVHGIWNCTIKFQIKW